MIEVMSQQRGMQNAWLTNPRVFNTSDPGTGKTIGALLGWHSHPHRGRLLVFAPKSILRPSWLADMNKVLPDISAAIIESPMPPHSKLATLLNTGVEVVITNHDQVKFIAENLDALDGFSHVIIDESTAFKHANTARSKAMQKVVKQFNYRQLMTGTPNSNGALNVWHQAFLLDDGQRLGAQFYGFRNAVADSRPAKPNDPNCRAMIWTDRPGAVDYVIDKLKDITVRYSRDECLDLPEHQIYTMTIEPPPKLKKLYKEMLRHSLIELESGTISAVNAGVRVNKLLQMLSGTAYGEDGAAFVHDARYQLVIDLVAARDHSVVAYNWDHQLETLVQLCERHGIKYGMINGGVSASKRAEYVEQFQAGELQVLFCHPKSAGHGLTLTRGTTTIWASPTYDAELYEQLNARIYRKGQTRKTETIRIAYSGTKEEAVYDALDNKRANMNQLLSMFAGLTATTA